MTMTDTEAILSGVRAWADENDVDIDPVDEANIVVVLPGEKKLKTNVSISVAARTVQLKAFVIRHPDENAAEFNRWLLLKNLKPGPVAFALDTLGDVHLVASVPRHRLLEELDSLLGAILAAADSSFNELLQLGFLTGMKKEWAWRVSRGESTRNLAAFEDVLSGPDNEFLANSEFLHQAEGAAAAAPESEIPGDRTLAGQSQGVRAPESET